MSFVLQRLHGGDWWRSGHVPWHLRRWRETLRFDHATRNDTGTEVQDLVEAGGRWCDVLSAFFVDLKEPCWKSCRALSRTVSAVIAVTLQPPWSLGGSCSLVSLDTVWRRPDLWMWQVVQDKQEQAVISPFGCLFVIRYVAWIDIKSVEPIPYMLVHAMRTGFAGEVLLFWRAWCC